MEKDQLKLSLDCSRFSESCVRSDGSLEELSAADMMGRARIKCIVRLSR